MAFVIGTTSKYGDANSIGDAAIAVAAKAIKLGAYKAQFYQAMVAPDAPFIADTADFEIYNRTLTTKSGTITEAIVATDATTITLDAVGSLGLTVGSIIQIGTEKMWISAINRTTLVATVSRGYGGTTAATALDDAVWTAVGYAGNDTNLKNVDSATEATAIYTNYLQTIFETMDYEKMAKVYRRKGLNPDQIDLILLEEAMVRVARNLGYMAIHGDKQLGTASLAPSSAGLLSQLADTASSTRPVLNYGGGSAALTEAKLRAALKVVTRTGEPDTIWVSQSQKEVINGFNSSIIQTGRLDTQAGSYVDTYDYDGLKLNVRVDSDFTDAKLAIVTQSKCQKAWVPGDMLRVEDEPADSSREFRKSIQGTFGFIIEGVGYDHITIDALTA